jgi:autotransporter-associated beta strand protein
MKTTLQKLQALLAAVTVLAVPFVASAGTTFSQQMLPATDNATQGTAANLVYSNPNGIKVTATSGYTGGPITNGYSIVYSGGASASPGITVAFGVNPIPLAASSSSFSTVTVATTTGTTAGTYTVTIFGTNNAHVDTSTYTLTVAASGAVGPGMVWNGSSSTSWSTGSNWTPAGPPVSTNDVYFYDAGAAGSAGTVDNIVGGNTTIGSLTYGNTNNFHTTQINAGVTLTVGGDTNGLYVGTGTAAGNLAPVSTVTGSSGALVVSNAGANMIVSQSNPSGSPSLSDATLDLSGLGTFNATVSSLQVGVDSVLKGANGILNLAATNIITLTPGSASPQIDVGDNSQASGATGGAVNTLLLGKTNAIYADSIEVGKSRTVNSSMLFNSAFTSPSAYFRGTNGSPTGRVSTWYIGDGGVGKVSGFVCFGTNDFSLGTVNVMADKMFVGAGSSATGTGGSVTTSAVGNGTLTMGAGKIDVNTLQVGYTVAANGVGTVNVNGGTLMVNTLLELANGVNALGPSSGTLNISGGTVTANGGIVAGGGTSTITLNSGALTVTNGVNTIGTVASAVTALNLNGGTLNLAVQGLTTEIVTTNLTTTGTTVVNISSVPLLTGFPTEFPLIKYQNPSVSGTFSIGTMPSGSPAYGAYLTNDTSINAIAIVFTNGPSTPALTWDGTPNGNWNTATANWRPKTGPDTTYADGNFVTFDDSLTGTPNVNLTTTVSPGSLTVSNSTATYVFSGSGHISGSATLVKNNSGTLTLADTGGDNFSGGILINNGTLVLDNANGAITGSTTINGGVVQLGNNDNLGLSLLGNVADGGTLIFNQNNSVIATNVISGSGVLVQNSALQNTLTLTGNSSFTGTAIAAQGTLQVGSTNGLGTAGSVVVSNGATLDVNGFALFGNGNSGLAVTVAGNGVGGNGAIVNNGTSATRVLHNVTMTADTTFGGTGDWDIRNSSGNSATADASLTGAYNLTKAGTNTLTLRGVTVDSNLGNISVLGGELHFTATATAPISTLGDSIKTATVFSNATLTFDTIGNIPGKNISLNNGGTLKSSSANLLSSPIALTGSGNAITVISPSIFTVNNTISGGGSLTKNGSGILYLNTTETYSGNTVVSSGTLALYSGGFDGSINNSPGVSVSSGATIDVSGRGDGTFTVATGQTLSGGVGTNGPGTINGSLLVSILSAIAPGGGTNTGTLSVSSNATLSGSAALKVSAVNGNDQITAYALTYGGTLLVTNAGGAITNGQTFKLFNATNGVYNAGTFTSVALPSASGLTWTNNLTSNGTITAGVASGPTGPGSITNHVSGTTLSLSWPAGQGWRLQAQTNSLSSGLTVGGWSYLTDGSVSSTNITIDPSKPAVFYRLTYP